MSHGPDDDALSKINSAGRGELSDASLIVLSCFMIISVSDALVDPAVFL